VVSAVKKARAQVLSSARAVNHTQKPTYVDEIAEGEFVLFASLVPVPVVPPPPTGPSAAQIEQEAWDLAKRGNTQGAYEAYLRGYPQGRYAQAAQVALAGLKPVAPVVVNDPPVQPPAPRPATFSAGQVFKDCQEAYCPEMVVIPAGSFQMGSNDFEEEKPIHNVTLKSFAMGKYEVTQGQWKAVMGNNPSQFTSCGDICPVEQVSWDDIQLYIQKLNAKSGQQYRLPSEAEWEYAAKAGSKGKWSFRSDEGQLGEHAWHGANSNASTHAVGQKKPNAFGLYDMHGNVWERVQDNWHDDYKGAPIDGSAWVSGENKSRVLRGGSWFNFWEILSSTSRVWYAKHNRVGSDGFRLARTLLTP
jgi:formylglycine-generating enzyme required for sulfatase activity